MQGPPPAGGVPWDMYEPPARSNKDAGPRKVVKIEIDRVIDVPRAQNALGKYVVGGYALQVETMDGYERTPYIGTFEPVIGMDYDNHDTENFTVHQIVEIAYYGDIPPPLKVCTFRCDTGGKPFFMLGVTVANPVDRRSLQNYCYAIEPKDRPGDKVLGGLYMRLSGQGVGEGDESTVEKTHYTPEAQHKKKKQLMPSVILRHEKPTTPFAEVFLQRVMDMKTSNFGDGEKYLELVVHSGDDSFSRCKIKVNKGIYCQRQPDGSIKWTWGDAQPRTSWEQYKRTYYTKDPVTGIVTKQGGDGEAHMVGPYFPEPDPVHPDSLESMILDETVNVPTAVNQHGLSLMVKLGSMGFFGYNVIGVSEPIPIDKVNFDVPCEYQFAKIFSLDEDDPKHIGTITLACQLCMPWELGKTVPRVPYVEGFWSRDCVFGPYANESKPYLVGMDEYQERLEMRPPKFSRITWADRGTETREKNPIARVPLPESGLGMMMLNRQVAPLIGPGGADWRLPQNAPFEMIDSDGVDWQALKSVDDEDDDGNSQGLKHKEQNPLYPNPAAVDIHGVLSEGKKIHRDVHDKAGWDPQPYQPWNKPMITQIYHHGDWQPGPGVGTYGTYGVPMAKDIEKYASDLVTKSGPLQGPTSKKGEGCPIA